MRTLTVSLKIEKLIKGIPTYKMVYQEDLIDAVNENIRNINVGAAKLAIMLTFISFPLIGNHDQPAVYFKTLILLKLVGNNFEFIRYYILKRRREYAR